MLFVLPSFVIDLEQYINRFGRSPFQRWYDTLADVTRARIVVALDRLRQGSKSVKSVGGGVTELRLDFGPGYRIYFGRDGETLVILLGGGIKKRQDADIEAAQHLWREYKQRKREN